MHLVGIDENGLGSRLGPLVVTGVRLEANAKGQRLLRRPLPSAIAEDLNDSKVLVSCHAIALAEAWARATYERVTGKVARKPNQIFEFLSLQSSQKLKKICPDEAKAQCWYLENEKFVATADEVIRIKSHLDWLENRGVYLRSAGTVVFCTSRLNTLKQQGIHRFAADLRGMEELLLSFRAEIDEPLIGNCGKVGGIGDYGKYFSLLTQELFSIVEERREKSTYHFAHLGVISFIKDADAQDPGVMLSSLLGKYMRELTMKRISSFYMSQLPELDRVPSGYHDPVSDAFVISTERLRVARKLPITCFERTREPKLTKKSPAKTRVSATRGTVVKNLQVTKKSEKEQGSLF